MCIHTGKLANHNNEKPVFYGILLPQSKCPILLKVFVLHNKKFFFSTGKAGFFSRHVNHIYHTEERKKEKKLVNLFRIPIYIIFFWPRKEKKMKSKKKNSLQQYTYLNVYKYESIYKFLTRFKQIYTLFLIFYVARDITSFFIRFLNNNVLSCGK